MTIESRTCEHVEALTGVDTPKERAAFLRWWEGSGKWSGSPCAVAYAGWLARAGQAVPSVWGGDIFRVEATPTIFHDWWEKNGAGLRGVPYKALAFAAWKAGATSEAVAALQPPTNNSVTKEG